MATRIYGASDNLVEVEGDVCGEVSDFSEEDGVVIVVDDGTIARVRYSIRIPGVWSIDVLRKGTLFDRLDICTDEDEVPYSDQLFLRDGAKAAWYAWSFRPVE